MEKISVVFPKKRRVSFDFGKGEKAQKIIVRPHVAMYEMVEIIKQYLFAFFEGGAGQFDNLSTNALFAEGVFDIALLDILTNVNMDTEESGGASLDELYNSGLMTSIKSRIQNLPALIEMRDRVVQDAMNERFSLKGFLDMITDAVKNLDMEKLAELQKEYQELKDTIGDSPLGDLMREGS